MMIKVSRLYIFPAEKVVGQPTRPGYIATGSTWINEKDIDYVSEIILSEKERQEDWFAKLEEHTKETGTNLFSVLLKSGYTVGNILLTKEELLKLTS